jgi:hypothetical protein
VKVGKTTSQGKGGPTQKLIVSVAIDKCMSNDAQTVVMSDIPGLSFGLNTLQLEASPDELCKNSDAKGPLVVDLPSPETECKPLNFIQLSLFPPAVGQARSGDSQAFFDACMPGMRVSIANITCGFSRNTSTRLYANVQSKNITTSDSPVALRDAPARLIRALSEGSMQKLSAFLVSTTVQGFFGWDKTDSAIHSQVEACHNMWKSYLDSLTESCDKIGARLEKDDSRAVTSASLNKMKERLVNLTPKDAATGSKPFEMNPDNYIAPIVQVGIRPRPDAMHKFIDTLVHNREDNAMDGLTCFCAASVENIDIIKNLARVEMRSDLVFDVNKAKSAVASKMNPILQLTNSNISFKLALNTFGPEIIGSVDYNKVTMAIREVLPYMNFGTMCSVYSREEQDTTLIGDFVPTQGFDMVDGIQKVGAQVRKEWIVQNMLNRGAFIYKDPTTEIIEKHPNAGPFPVLEKSGYQALTESNYEMDDFNDNGHSALLFYVVYAGCSDDVNENENVATDVEAGENSVTMLHKRSQSDKDIKTFLRTECIVYVVSVA